MTATPLPERAPRCQAKHWTRVGCDLPVGHDGAHRCRVDLLTVRWWAQWAGVPQ